MTTSFNKEAVKAISKTVGLLSDPKSYEQVYHRPQMNDEMLSVKAIKEIMENVKEIIFPGYFGNTSVRADTVQFHMGVIVDKLHKLLKTQINRGYCFTCDQDNCNDCE